MGDYVVTAAVQAQKMLDPADFENTLAEAVTAAILKNTEPSLSIRYAPTDISVNIKTAYANNFASKAETYFDYGDHSHPDGIPTNKAIGEATKVPPDVLNDEPEANDVIDIIELAIGVEIELLHYTYSPVKANILINDWLIHNSSYTVHRRQSGDAANTTMNVYDFTDPADGKRYRVSGPIEHDGTTLTCTATQVSQYADYDRISEVDYDWGYGGRGFGRRSWLDIPNPATKELSITTIAAGTLLHQVVYQRQDTLDVDFWYYDQADDTYPEIHTTLAVTEKPGCFPFAMIIDEKQKVADGKLGADYEHHTTELLNKLNIDLDDLMDSMEDPDDPDALKDVSDAFVMFAIDINTNEQGGLAYLYEHFRHSHFVDNVYTQANWISDGANKPLGQNGRAYNGQRVKFNVNYNWSTVAVKTGVVTGFHAMPNVTTPVTPIAEVDANNNGRTYIDEATQVEVGKVTTNIYEGNHDNYNGKGEGWNNHFIVIRKQLNPTEYVEIIVHGIEHFSRPRGKRKNRYFTKGVVGTLGDVSSGAVFIPIGHEIISQFDKLVSSYALQDGLQCIIHVVNVRKKKWYETGWLTVLRVVIAVFTWGTSEIWMQGVWAIVKNIIINMLIEMLVVQVLMILVEMIGGDIAIILAAIASLYALSNGAGDKILFDLLKADELLQAGTLMINATNEVASERMLDDQHRLDEHNELMETEHEKIEKAADLLDEGIDLELYDIIDGMSYANFYESPAMFFNRCCHLTNPGVLCLDAIDSYVQGNCRLPTADTNPINNVMA